MEKNYLEKVSQNKRGQDFIIGDIHGHFDELMLELQKIEFDVSCDRLFSVGDLIDRGNQHRLVTELVDETWFFPVRGNHDQFIIDQYDEERVLRYQYEGYSPEEIHLALEGEWFAALAEDDRRWFYRKLVELPYLIELETTHGSVGICHAGVPPDINDWNALKSQLDDRNTRELVLRTRQAPKLNRTIKNIALTVHGHTCFESPKKVGNSLFIDTYDKTGKLTLLNIADLIEK
ncbi:metallophosphoesterase [Thiomicrorhabdus sp.]|uniref:metallophosphoesterase n=1 Tax=Thiomicrorhabdus sp. TaxID=2039724 RepID=UPI00356A4BB2